MTGTLSAVTRTSIFTPSMPAAYAAASAPSES